MSRGNNRIRARGRAAGRRQTIKPFQVRDEMIVFRAWKQTKSRKIGEVERFIWRGWFLFGIIPLYLERISVDL